MLGVTLFDTQEFNLYFNKYGLGSVLGLWLKLLMLESDMKYRFRIKLKATSQEGVQVNCFQIKMKVGFFPSSFKSIAA